MASRKSGPPAHQNSVAWVPSRMDKHNNLRKIVNALPNDGVCKRCHEQIEWKKKYGKYKPLKVPGKCAGCDKRTVELAYHSLCQPCASAKRSCAKCMQEAPLPATPTMAEQYPKERMPDASELAEMNERQRRSVTRKVERAKCERKAAEKAARDAAAGEGPDAAACAAHDKDDESEEEEEEEVDDDEMEVDDDEIVVEKPAADVLTHAAAAARKRAAKAAAGFAAPPASGKPPAVGPPAADVPSSGTGGAFIASASFAGSKPGYVFRAGAEGVGYYRDAAAGATVMDVSDASPAVATGSAEQPVAHLAALGGDVALGSGADAASETCWSDRDLNGRTPSPSAGEATAMPALNADDAAAAAVEAENVTDDEEGEEGEEGDDDDDDEDEDEEEVATEELREQLDCLGHSAGARALVMQSYCDWLLPEHMACAEAGFDALCERLAEAGGGAAAAADAMTDRLARVAESEDELATTLAMLLELECYARTLPASFDADATSAEQAARRLFERRGA